MKATKKLLVVLATIISMGTAYANPQNTLEKQVEKEFNQLNSKQKEVLKKTIKSNPKHGTLLGAISWKESSAGLKQINVNKNGSMDCGNFGINTNSFLMKKGIKITQKSKKDICEKLIANQNLGKEAAINELNLWANEWNKDIKSKKVIGSYNGGYKPNFEYSNDVLARANLLQKKLKLL